MLRHNRKRQSHRQIASMWRCNDFLWDGYFNNNGAATYVDRQCNAHGHIFFILEKKQQHCCRLLNHLLPLRFFFICLHDCIMLLPAGQVAHTRKRRIQYDYHIALWYHIYMHWFLLSLWEGSNKWKTFPFISSGFRIEVLWVFALAHATHHTTRPRLLKAHHVSNTNTKIHSFRMFYACMLVYRVFYKFCECVSSSCER